MARNGQIILAKNIKLDKDYKDLLDYTEQEMLALVNENAVASDNDYSFIRVGENRISVGFNYATCLQANYIAFQNPNYSNKWFFAFIDEVKYISDKATEIVFTVDVHSTWFDNWDVKTCFVIREHVTDDTIGLHTVPEQIEHGEYVVNGDYSSIPMGGFNTIVVGSTVDLTSDSFPDVQGDIIGGVYSGVKYYYFSSESLLNNRLKKLAESKKSDAIKSIFMGSLFDTEAVGSTGIDVVKSNSIKVSSFYSTGESVLSKPTKIGNYTPKNKKLLTFPYVYALMSNNAGNNAIYHYELFSDNTPNFRILSVCTPGMSIRLQPKNYNGVEWNNEEGLNAGKLPICSWDTDVYTNWLTQNGVNIALSVGSTLATIGAGVGMVATGAGAVAGAGMIAGGASSLISQANEIYQHSLVPQQAEGNTNSGDVNYALHHNKFYLYDMSIKEEYARIIDDILTRTGYKVNRLKTPNMNTRTYYNYVQIGSDENIGYSTSTKIPVPKDAMNTINNIYRSGTTIWHNHIHVGNYAVDNSIH